MGMNKDLEQFIFQSKYTRFNWDIGRRETWEEAIVDRVMPYLRKSSDYLFADELYEELQDAIVNKEVALSMRLLNQAGAAAERNGLSAFNCSYLPIESSRSFADMTFALLSGVGVAFSVETNVINKWPRVKSQTGRTAYHIIEDTSEGWADAIEAVIYYTLNGTRIEFSYDDIRPAGSILKTKGGRASGPEPLRETIDAIRNIIVHRQGQCLRSIDLYDIACFISGGVISGGNRRSALLCAFSHDDDLMMSAKTGNWFEENPQRMNSNNSMVIPEGYAPSEMSRFFRTMLESDSGEPGFLYPSAMYTVMKDERLALYSREEVVSAFRANVCGEIAPLAPYGTCNLSMIIPRPTDTLEDLKRKARLATFVGVLQADITNFQYVGDQWHDVLNKERLLGVSLAGFAECSLLMDKNVLRELYRTVRKYADEYSEALGMDAPSAVTTVKPSGNSSLLYGVGSGIHAWHAPYFLRNTMLKKTSPIYALFIDVGVPMSDMVGREGYVLVHFPMKAPDGAIVSGDLSAIEQLERYETVRDAYTDLHISVTISYDESEIDGIVDWLMRSIQHTPSLSFLKNNNGTYPQMPLEEITQEEYAQRVAQWPKIEWERLSEYENTDMTTSSQELSCVAGACEVDFTPKEMTFSVT